MLQRTNPHIYPHRLYLAFHTVRIRPIFARTRKSQDVLAIPVMVHLFPPSSLFVLMVYPYPYPYVETPAYNTIVTPARFWTCVLFCFVVIDVSCRYIYIYIYIYIYLALSCLVDCLHPQHTHTHRLAMV